MSAAINDFASGGLVAAGLYPDTRIASVTGSAIDMIAADGECFAVQQVGDFSDDTTLAGHIEESANGTSWSAISGATFDTVSASNAVQVIRFTRTARYVRYVGTLTGDSPSVQLAVLIGQQKKTI